MSPDSLSALADLGWATLFLGTVVIIAVGMLRQWWVPGWIYRERERATTELRAENAELVKTNVRLTEQLRYERQRRRGDHGVSSRE